MYVINQLRIGNLTNTSNISSEVYENNLENSSFIFYSVEKLLKERITKLQMENPTSKLHSFIY